MTRDWVDYWNLAFNGVGATITLLTAAVAVVSFFVARSSKRAAERAEARAKSAEEAEARTAGHLARTVEMLELFNMDGSESNFIQHSDATTITQEMREKYAAMGLPLPPEKDSFARILADIKRGQALTRSL